MTIFRIRCNKGISPPRAKGTTTGKTYDVTGRDLPLLLVGKTSLIIGRHLPDTDPFFDRYEVVSLVHIVRLEPIPIETQQQSA